MENQSEKDEAIIAAAFIAQLTIASEAQSEAVRIAMKFLPDVANRSLRTILATYWLGMGKNIMDPIYEKYPHLRPDA
jgi:hypothetical protein